MGCDDDEEDEGLVMCLGPREVKRSLGLARFGFRVQVFGFGDSGV